MNKQVLKYFCVRHGKQKLNEYFESTINKKKHRKGASASVEGEGVINQFNFFNFVQANPVRKPKHFLHQQLINGLEGKGLEREYSQVNQSHQIQSLEENIRKFQILHKKIVQKVTFKEPKQIMSKKKIKQIAVIRKSLSLFTNVFQDEDLNQRIKANRQQVNRLKSNILFKYNQNCNKLRFQMFLFFDNLKAHFQLLQLKHSYKQQNSVRCPILQNREELILSKISFLFSNYLQQLFTKCLELVRLKEILTFTTVKKNWDAKDLLKEQNDFIGKKITGKMLYSLQQDKSRFKGQLLKKDIWREYYLRQKSHNFNTNTNSNSIKMIQFDNQTVHPKNRQKWQQNRHRTIVEVPQARVRSNSTLNVELPKSKRRVVNVSSKDKKINLNPRDFQDNAPKYQKYYISNLSDLKSLPKKSPALNGTLSQPNRINHIKPFDINSFDEFAYNPNSQINSRNVRTQAAPSYTNLKIFKYPIKIECLEILTAESSHLSYNVQNYSLKELPLKFIKDRIKFKENRVKIEYPFNFSSEIEVKVAKSLQILSCLGAEVTCQMQSSYKHWNQIDEVEVMSVSWLLEMPVRQVVYCYANFFCAKQTKK